MCIRDSGSSCQKGFGRSARAPSNLLPSRNPRTLPILPGAAPAPPTSNGRQPSVIFKPRSLDSARSQIL
eukprot:1711851-Alexandrium_andersonii.AAC.1